MTEEMKYYTGNCITDLHTNTSISNYKTEFEKLKEENALLKEQLLKKTETEQSFQSLLEENEELKKKIELDEVQLNSYFVGEEKICKENEKYRSVLEEIKEDIRSFYDCEDSSNDYKLVSMIDKINEVLNA